MIKATPISVKTPVWEPDPQAPGECPAPTPFQRSRPAREHFLNSNRGQ